MKIFDPKLTGSIEVLNTITGDITLSGNLNVGGNLEGSITGSVTASYIDLSNVDGSASLASNIEFNSSSIASLESVSGSYANSASFATDIFNNSASIASLESNSGSYLLSSTDTFTGDLTVTGEVIAQTLHVQEVTSSIVYSSGSNVFGETVADTQKFTGSLQVSGSNSYILGNLGIGTDSPLVKLDTRGSISAQLDTAYYRLRRTNGTDVGYITDSTTWGDSGTDFSIGASSANLRFYTNNSVAERMRIDSNGDVGINVNNPIRKLHIQGDSISSDTPTVRISSTDSSGTNKFGIEFYSTNGADVRGKILADNNGRVYIDDNGGGGVVFQANGGSGNVGIGTINPGYPFHISSTSVYQAAIKSTGAQYLLLGSEDANGAGIIFDGDSNGDGAGGDYSYIVHENSGILNITQDSPSGTNEIRFGTAGAENKVIIDTNGNLGIGVTTLTYRTEIAGNNSGYWNGSAFTATPLALSINNTQAGGYDSTLIFQQSDSGGTVKNAGGIGMVGRASWTAGNNATQISDMYFLVRNDSGGISERMRIDSNGNVGIGAINPSYKLDVRGGDIKLNHGNSAGNYYLYLNKKEGQDGGILLQRDNSLDWQIVNTGTTGNLLFYSYGGGGITALTFKNSNGYVGIRSTNPENYLSVNSGGSNGFSSGTLPPGITIYGASTDGYGSMLSFKPAEGDQGVAGIGSFRVNNYETDLRFYTNNSSSSEAFSERMRITSDGDVGIGTDGPGYKLDVAGIASFGTSTQTQIGNAASNPTDAGISYGMFHNSGVGLGIVSGAGGSTQGTVFWSNNGSSYFQSARISGANGNVFIGPTLTASGYDSVKNGWILNYDGGGSTVANFSGNNEIFTFNQRDGAGTTQIDFRNGNVERGRIEWTTSGTTYNTVSDYRLKENITNLSGSLAKIEQLEPKTFNFISDPDDLRIGFIAHEVQNIVPQAVSGIRDDIREDGTPKYQGLDHSMLVPLLVGAVKELSAKNDELQARLEVLEG